MITHIRPALHTLQKLPACGLHLHLTEYTYTCPVSEMTYCVEWDVKP